MKTGLKITILAAGLAFGQAAFAQGSPGMGPVAAACGDDIAKLCPGKEHGQGAVRDCLEANVSKVTPACKKAMDSTGWGRKR